MNSKKLWQGYYCCVPECKNSTGRNKERSKIGLPKLSFHSFPDITSAKGKAWIKRIRHDPGSNFVVGKNTKICSEHFKDDDFAFGNLSLTGGRRRLKHEAIPSIFAWNKTIERISLTSQKALQPSDIVVHVKQVKYLSLNDNVNEEIVHNETESICDLDPSIADLQKEILDLKIKLLEAQYKLERSLFRLDNIKNDDSLVKFYTGFADFGTLMAFYEEILESDASVMRQWGGQRSERDYEEAKVGPCCKLSLTEQFFLTLVRIQLALPELDIAVMFGISQSSVSRITNT